VGELAPAAARFIVRRVPRALRRLRDPAAGARATDSLLREPDPLDEPPAALAGREVGLLSGLARPASFRRTVEALGARVVAERCFPDHHPYAARDLAGLAAAAPLWITTEKDAVKIEPEWVGGAELRVLAIDIEGVEPLVEFVSARLREIRSNAGSEA
jgi:tetraacyldisaccharide 4'-kinase